jgi:hypothetical protein
MSGHSKDYDGFYILPADEDDGLKMAYFDFKDDFEKGEKLGGNALGDMYHVIFFKVGEDSLPILDDHFESIFAEPETYVKGLLGANLFGCFVKKTENSWKWVDDYLKNTLSRVTLMKMKNYANSIAEGS